MVRVHGRPLKGSEIRHFENSLRNAGVKREVFRAIQRGDSPSAVNRLFKQAGYNFDRFGVIDYVARTYGSKTSVRYFDKIAARYGSRSKVNIEAFRRAGWGGKLHLTIQGLDRYGEIVFRTLEVDGAKYESIGDLIDEINDGLLDDWAENYIDPDTLEIVNYRFY